MPGKVSRTSLLGRERNKAGRGTKRSKCDTLGKVWLSTWPGTVPHRLGQRCWSFYILPSIAHLLKQKGKVLGCKHQATLMVPGPSQKRPEPESRLMATGEQWGWDAAFIELLWIRVCNSPEIQSRKPVSLELALGAQFTDQKVEA